MEGGLNSCSSKKNFNHDDVLMNGYEDLPTFQETFPLDIPMDDDDGLCLKRR
jgi:hypothetical protein